MSNYRRGTTPHPDRGSPPGPTRFGSIAWVLMRVLIAGIGIGFLALAITHVPGHFTDVREFNHVMHCGRGADCFEGRTVSVVGRRTYETTTTTDSGGSFGANGVYQPGTTTTRTETSYEITWQQPDGTRQTREVSRRLYQNAREGQPATLRQWRGQLVGITAGTETYWFSMPSVAFLAFWLAVGVLGLSTAISGALSFLEDELLYLLWPGLICAVVSFFVFAAIAHVLAYGLHIDLVIGSIGLAAVIACCGFSRF